VARIHDHARLRNRRSSHEERRLTVALVASALLHTLLLQLTFGGQGIARPGFGFPWGNRQIEMPDLRLLLVPLRIAANEPARPSGAPAASPPVTPQRAAGEAQPMAAAAPRSQSSAKMTPAAPRAPPAVRPTSRRNSAPPAPAQATLPADRPVEAPLR